MWPELALFSLILAALMALVQVTVPVVGLYRQDAAWMQIARITTWAQWGLVVFCFASLVGLFVANDFSVVYVASHSHSTLPLIYRFCATWGGHEGSILLWVLILTTWMALVAWFHQKLSLSFQTRVLVILGLIALGFYGFLLLTSNPFLRALFPVPAEGVDLNPLLQDPGMVSHPPFLYLGYVGFAVPFAFAMAALWEGPSQQPWAKWAARWTTMAWSFLSIGIVLGSWWAYRELGWGGFWFWDPVENASFMPWLAGTALIHSLRVAEKRDLFKVWSVLLSVAVFALSLIGTFLVRSGVLISVHSFAADPKRGAYILIFLSLVIGVSLLLFTFRSARLQNKVQMVSFASREFLLMMNNLLLAACLFTVLLGTLYPMLVSVMGLGVLSVGAPYFNRVFGSMMIPLVLLMAVGPYSQWGRSLDRSTWIRWGCAWGIAGVLAVLLLWGGRFSLNAAVWIGLMLALGLMGLLMESMARIRSFKKMPWGMLIAHMGFAVTLIGVVFAANLSHEKDVELKVGEWAVLENYQFHLLGVQSIQGENYKGVQALVEVFKNGNRAMPFSISLRESSSNTSRNDVSLGRMKPEIRYFTADQSSLSKVAIMPFLTKDIYVALGRPIPERGAWGMRLYEKPFVRWIWIGGLMMALGGVLALVRKKECQK